MITIMWEVMYSAPTGRPVAELAQRGFRSPPDALYFIHTKQIQMTTENQIQTIIESLQDMKKILSDARPEAATGYTIETSYPFAVGYTSAGIDNVIFSLCQLLK